MTIDRGDGTHVNTNRIGNRITFGKTTVSYDVSGKENPIVSHQYDDFRAVNIDFTINVKKRVWYTY